MKGGVDAPRVLGLGALVGAWKTIGLALLIGSIAVGIGAAFSEDIREAGPLITVGAIVSSCAFGTFVVLWTTTAWTDVLLGAAIGVVFFGTVPTLIGLWYWRRQGHHPAP
jgi:hypothetical protein